MMIFKEEWVWPWNTGNLVIIHIRLEITCVWNTCKKIDVNIKVFQNVVPAVKISVKTMPAQQYEERKIKEKKIKEKKPYTLKYWQCISHFHTLHTLSGHPFHCRWQGLDSFQTGEEMDLQQK